MTRRSTKIRFVHRLSIALSSCQWRSSTLLCWATKCSWTNLHTFKCSRQIVCAWWMCLLAWASLRSCDWGNEIGSVRGMWSFTQTFLLARTRLERWRWHRHNTLMSSSLRRWEKVGNEVRHTRNVMRRCWPWHGVNRCILCVCVLFQPKVGRETTLR